MLKAEFQSGAREIDSQRPFEIAVAISANDHDWRTDRAKLIQDALRANVSKVPNLVGVVREFLYFCWQPIVRISQNENAKLFHQAKVAHNS